MAKFVKVKKAPETLERDEYVIGAPEFMEEVGMYKRRAPKTKCTSANYLRDIIASIGDKYVRDKYGENALVNINVSRHRGIPFQSDEDVNEIVKNILAKFAPQTFDCYVDYHIKQRPFGTKLIYFTGDHSYTGAFTANGIDEIKEGDIAEYMGRKIKKKIGKPIEKSSTANL